MPDAIQEYAVLVCGQLRWKKARPAIAREITAHLLDQRDALIKKGMDAEEATGEAVRQMGDAVEIGAALDRVHRPKPAWELFALTVLLLLSGLLINMFISLELAESGIIGAFLGLGCMLGAYFLDFTIIGRRPLAVYFGAIALFALSLYLAGWLYRAGQPLFESYVQYVTMLFPLAYAALLYRLRGKKYTGLFLALAGLVLLSVCCLRVPSLAGLSITGIAGLALLFVAAAGDWFSTGKSRALLFAGAVTLSAGILLLLAVRLKSALAAHVAAAFDPWSAPMEWGWSGVIIRELIAGARFIGCGTAEAHSLPDFTWNTDFLLTWLIHRLGWGAFIVVLVILAAFLFCGFRRCLKQTNVLGRLVSLAVMLTLSLETVFYVAYNLGFCLILPFSLPLISYGNAATIVNMGLIGVMLSAFRTGALVRDTAIVYRTAPKRLFWNDGTLTISFKRHME